MKRGIFITLVVATTLTLVFLLIIKLGMRRLRLEDEVPHKFIPVVKAILDFEDTNGASPQSLSDLVPCFIESIPTSDSIRNVDYICAQDGSNWLLTVTCQIGREKLRYCMRTDRATSWPNEWEQIGIIHGWHVLKKKNE